MLSEITGGDIVNYLLNVILITTYQILILLAPLVILAFLLNYIARMNEKIIVKLFGVKGYLFGFGWLGVPVHELAHAFFAFIFMHRIQEVKLFSPNMENGALGYVAHNYNRRNLYHNIGNFFIGIAPLLICPLILLLITYSLFGLNLLSTGQDFKLQIIEHAPFIAFNGEHLLTHFSSFLQEVFFGNSTNWWKITLFIYLLLAVGSSISLSKADIKGALSGFYTFIIVLILINLITQWHGDFVTSSINQINNWLGGFYYITVIALITNFLLFLIIKVFDILKK